MKHVNTHFSKFARPLATVITVMAALLSTPASADEYSDVSQLLRAGKLSEATLKVDQYLATKPRDPQMRFFKGVIQRDSGKPVEAIATFTKLTEDYPELPEPYNNLAVMYASQSQYDKARTALEMAIRTNPSYATAHENLGDVYARLASQAYNKALQLDTNNTAVAPKLALIRELFAPNSKAPRPVVATSAAPATPATPTPPVKPVTAPAVVASAAVPVAPVTPKASGTSPSGSTASNDAVKDAEAAVLAWAAAWSRQDVTAYLGAYGKAFATPGNLSRADWENERRARIVGKSSISVKLENLVVSVNGDKAIAKFKQSYKADALVVSGRKTLELVKVGEQWQIVRESSGA